MPAKELIVNWDRDGNANVKPVKGDVKVLEAARVMEAVCDGFSISTE